MSATDNMNKVQFMATTDVGKMESGDYEGSTVEEAYQSHLDGMAKGFHNGPRSNGLHDDIAANGIRTPLVSGPGNQLLNGHHRYYEARRQGIESVPVTSVPDARDYYNAPGDD